MQSTLRPLVLALVVASCGASASTAAAADVTVRSFDGTSIVAHWFPSPGLAPGGTAPTVLMGPGWGSAGDTDVAGRGSDGVGLVGIADLHDAGYNVLTWDPRGFGASGGRVESDSPRFEGRDAQALISWVARRPGVQLDRPGDPRMGMAGASTGAGSSSSRRRSTGAPTPSPRRSPGPRHHADEDDHPAPRDVEGGHRVPSTAPAPVVKPTKPPHSGMFSRKAR